MAKRKTVVNWRVRGELRADSRLRHQGADIITPLLYLATILLDPVSGQLTVSVAANQFGPVNWQHPSPGVYSANLGRLYNRDRFFAWPIQSSHDTDGERLFPTISMGTDVQTQTSYVVFAFALLDGTQRQPEEFEVKVHFGVYQ